MATSLTLLSLTLLLLLTSFVSSIDFKIVVVVENSVIPEWLVAKAIERRVNRNWRLLNGHSMSYRWIQVEKCGVAQAVRSVCSQTDASAVVAVGNCRLISSLNSMAKSVKLPFVGLPVTLCSHSDISIDFGVIASHTETDFVRATAAALVASRANKAVILYDSWQSTNVLQNVQESLSQHQISSLTLQVDSPDGSVRSDLSSHLSRVVKKQVRHCVVLAETENVLKILEHANGSAVLQQNYFWLIIDTGISRRQLLNASTANANVALLRGGTTGVNDRGSCPAAVTDVFEDCDIDGVKTLDVRFVDAVESLARVFNLTMAETGFSVSNFSCSPSVAWASGAAAEASLASLRDFTTTRGVVSFNSSTRHFDAQGLEVIGSFNELPKSPMQMLLSGHFNTESGSMTRLYWYKGVSLLFPNTFMGFKNQTLVVCIPEVPPFASHDKVYANRTLELSGMTKEILDFLGEKMDFSYVAKAPNDGEWGSPQDGTEIFTGCVGEIQQDICQIGGATFTKTTARDAVIDYSFALFEEANGILVPRPAPASKLWNVFTPFQYDVWLLTIASLFFAAFVTWILAFFSPFTAYNLQLDYSIADEIWLQEYLWSVLGSFLQQGQDFYPFAMSPRTILAFWWLFTVILFGTYTGDLTAHLTISTTTLPIKSLEDLMAQTEIKPLVVKGTNFYTQMKEATSGIYKQVGDTMVTTDGLVNCAKLVFTESVGCITDYTFLLGYGKSNCTDVYVANEIFNAATVAYMYAEDAYFGETMDFYMRKLRESGAMQRLFNKYWSSDAVCSVGTSAEADPINLEGVGGCYIVTGGLYVAGLILLLLEFCWTKLCGKSPMDCTIY